MDGYPGLKNLIEISYLDAKIAGIKAEINRVESSFKDKKTKLKAFDIEWASKSAEIKSKKDQYNKEEKFLRTEQQKLVDRRKTLHTLGDYKLQMAAEREINANARQLSQQEDKLITVLEQIEVLEKNAKKTEDLYNSLRDEVAGLEADFEATIANHTERQKVAEQEREQLASQINRADLQAYDRVRERYVADSVVPLKGMACGGCFVELGQQFVQNVMRGKDLVRCKNCGRIVFIKPESI